STKGITCGGVARVQFLLWTSDTRRQRVYYSCGAVIDTQERGLILSPGFPNSYYPNTHCIWQFFVPAEVRLILEILDFDVFESPTEHGRLPDRHISTLQRQSKTVLSAEENDFPITTSKKVEAKQVVQQEQSTHLDLAKGTNAMGQSVSHVSIAQSSLVENAGRGDNDGTEGKIEDATPASDPTHSSPTQPPSLDVCPHDVLYISDLITFSSRFCGTNLPINRTLIFGSSVEMIEVIMELITTTGYGRGFLILFEYKNETEVNFIGVVKPRTGENATLLAIIAGVVLFAMVLMTALCLAY
uniref:Si:dkey-112e17.1 n=1 Tax=Latimeria chalumnae TaxID=7897 RepID=H3BEH6_LATCH